MKMSTALVSWRTRVKTMILKKGQSLAKIQENYPQITEAQYLEFKARCEFEAAKAPSKRGKEMREMNIRNHHLRSGGYRAAESKW